MSPQPWARVVSSDGDQAQGHADSCASGDDGAGCARTGRGATPAEGGPNDDDHSAIEAIDYYFDEIFKGMDIVNMSYSTSDGGSYDHMVKALEKHDVVAVAAVADSDVSQLYPAGLRGVVAVNAVDRNAKSWIANTKGPTVVISAPGVEVGTGTIRADGWHSDVWHDGTSVATAIVSGALALVKAKYPDATANQLIQHLVHYTGRAKPGWNSYAGYGIVSVTKMLKSSPTQWPDENPLLKGAPFVLENYPMWSSSLIDAPASANDKWAKAERAAKEQATNAEGRASEKAGTSDETRSSGLPAWAWLAGGVAVLAAAMGAGAGILRRKNSGA
jgi:subtilisin family serine protease